MKAKVNILGKPHPYIVHTNPLSCKPEEAHFKQEEMYLKACFETETALSFPHCLASGPAFQPHKNLLTQVKDPVPPEEKAGVVHKVPCGDCPATYVGQAKDSDVSPQGTQTGFDYSQLHDLCLSPNVNVIKHVLR